MKKNILIIEDEQDVAELYAKLLNAKGFVTQVAFDGVEGLQKLEKFTPDLVLLDINMPKMDGLEFYRKICDENQKPKYPVLILTARGNLEVLFKDFVVDGFIVKPFDGNRLLKEVEVFFIMQHLKKL